MKKVYLKQVHCKGNYVHECDMIGCHEIICGHCEHRVLHELCDKKGLQAMKEKLREPEIGEQFATVCWNCADKLNGLGIPTQRWKSIQIVTKYVNGERKEFLVDKDSIMRQY